ncbi:MAG: hypothetical protein ACI9CD_001209 [Candidatus Deianiraeaceae bacterium]|jgi:hypothetical protein
METKDMKKTAFAGFPPLQYVFDAYRDSGMFKDMGNFRHGDYAHYIQLYLLMRILTKWNYTEAEQQKFYTHLRSGRERMHRRKEGKEKLTDLVFIIDIIIVNSTVFTHILHQYNDPSRLTHELFHGKLSKQYPNYSGLIFLYTA